jgi:hypothetical protein
MMRLAVIVASCSLLGGLACGKSDKPADKPGPTQPAADAPGKVVPGTQGLHSLLAGAGKKAAPSKGSLGSLGGILGGVGAGGMKAGGGGTVDTAGVVGAAGKPEAGKADDEGGTGVKPATEEGKMGGPADERARVGARIPAGMKGGDCAAVGKRVGAMVKAQALAEAGDGEDEATRQMAEALVDQMVAQVPGAITQMCVAGGWTQELRDCMLTSDYESIDACERFVTPEMEAKMEAAARLLEGDEGEGGDDAEEPSGDLPPPKGPAPVWNGASNDCAAVGDHAVALAMWQMSGDPAAAAAAQAILGPIKDEVVNQCKSESWPEAARLCVLKASSLEALDACDSQAGGGGM